jgi:hypothetical protein
MSGQGRDDRSGASGDARPARPAASFSAAVRDAVIKGINELFSTPAVTSQHFQEVVEKYPVLLTGEGLDAVRSLASIQPEGDGKETVQRLHDILTRAMKVGVDTAIAEFSLKTSPDARNARLERERQRLRAARHALPIKAPHGPPPSMREKGQVFGSLRECRTQIMAQHPQATISVVAKDVDSHSDDRSEVIQWDAPRFMFRGESGLFPTTQTSLMRFRTDLGLSIETIETIIALSIRIRNQLVSQLHLSPRVAAAFLQHYGVPTRFFDVSSDLDVAFSFATNLSPGDWGAIAVLPVEALIDDSQSIMLADLTRHRMAERPRRQQAYAYVDYKYSDLKDPRAISDRKLIWHWFRFTAKDEENQRPDPYLLDAHSDGVAGLIGLFINDAARFDDDAARWLSQRVPAAPTVLRILERKADSIRAALVPAEDAGPQLFESSESSNYRRWSTAFAAPPIAAEVKDLGPVKTLDAADLATGATVWVLRSHVLQQLLPEHESDP